MKRMMISRNWAKVLVLVGLLFSPAISYSQGTLVWQKQYGHNPHQEECATSVKISSTRYVHGGTTYAPNSTYPYPSVIFTNSAGDSIGNFDYVSIRGGINSISTNSDGSFVASGIGYDSLGQVFNFMLKADSIGNIQWLRHYNENAYASNFGFKVQLLPDGYLLTANRLTQPSNPTFNISQLSVIKTDLTGIVQWQKTYGTYTEAWDLTPLPDGSFITVGYKINQNSGTPSVFYSIDLWLVKIKPNGDTLSSQVIGMPIDAELGNMIRPTADGGYIIAGAFVQNVVSTKRQGYVLKLNSNLQKQWEVKVMPGSGDSQGGCDLFDVQETVNSTYIVSGYFMDGSNRNNGYVAEITPGGTIAWSQLYHSPNPISEYFQSMIYEPDGSALFSGTYYKPTAPVVADFYLVKLTNLPLPYQPNYCAMPPTAGFAWSWNAASQTLSLTDTSRTHLPHDVLSRWHFSFGNGSDTTLYDPNGLYNSPPPVLQHHYGQTAQQLFGTPVTLTVTNNLFCTDTFTVYPWGKPVGIAETAAQQRATLHPNPATTHALLELPQPVQQAELRLYHPDGRLLLRQPVSGTSARLELQLLPPGLYLWQLHTPQGVQTGKVVRQ